MLEGFLADAESFAVATVDDEIAGQVHLTEEIVGDEVLLGRRQRQLQTGQVVFGHFGEGRAQSFDGNLVAGHHAVLVASAR